VRRGSGLAQLRGGGWCRGMAPEASFAACEPLQGLGPAGVRELPAAGLAPEAAPRWGGLAGWRGSLGRPRLRPAEARERRRG